MENINSNIYDRVWTPQTLTPNSCAFCGNEYGHISFKGKCVCEECLSYVKELM